MKRILVALLLLSSLAVSAAAAPKPIVCAPACSMKPHKDAHIVRHALVRASFPLRHPLRALKAIF